MPISDGEVARQVHLFQDQEFTPARAGNPIFCHQAFLEKLHEHRNDPIGKRAALLLHRLVLDERRQFYKSAQAANVGWRRSRLGGNHGNQFYAWWAPRGAPHIKGLAEFAQAPDGAIFVRDLRHHDDHSELRPQSLNDHYLPISVRELLRAEYAPLPWTTTQAKFADARQRVRIVKGYPGSGKTTALWNAAAQPGIQSILFVTFSPELAALARDHFDKFASRDKQFHVVTYPRLLRDLLGSAQPVETVRDCRARFIGKLAGLPPRTLGPWQGNRTALFDEIHAHLVGAALPVLIGRFPACQEPRLGDRAYRERREHVLGKAAADALLDTVQILRRREQGKLEDLFFPELALAWKAAAQLAQATTPSPSAEKLLNFDCIAVDEVQDLTPIEAFVLIELAALTKARRRDPICFLAAGDEAQTVRPTDFEWGWFHDLLHHRVGDPVEFKLAINLRSPRRIGELVNRVRDLYSQIQKQDRPSGLAPAEIDSDASDQVTWCTTVPGPELTQLLEILSAREGLAIISLSETVPEYIPESLRPRIFTVFEAKGLDFHSVCILDPGKHLERIVQAQETLRRDTYVEPLSKRLMIDQLRVAMSRPAERLYWLEVEPTESVLGRSLRFLNGWAREASVYPVIPAVVLKSLEEEILPVEERVRLCEEDARNYLEVKPEMAWTRARQAVALLGQPGTSSVADENVSRSAHLTLAQISFCLAFRKVRLPAELGHPDLYGEAGRHAVVAGKSGLASIFENIGSVERSTPAIRSFALTGLAAAFFAGEKEIEPWLKIEIGNKITPWLEEMESALNQLVHAEAMLALLPRLFQIFGVLDAEQRVARVRLKAIETLMAAGQFEDALPLLSGTGEPQRRLQAACFEGLGELRKAADLYSELGDWNAAMNICRRIPDLDKALELIGRVPDHPAAGGLQWIRRMQDAAAQRPADFLKIVTPQEAQLLQEILEQSLGVTRKKRAPRGTAAGGSAAKSRAKSKAAGSRKPKARASNQRT